jgi:uncharacterized membrane protein
MLPSMVYLISGLYCSELRVMLVVPAMVIAMAARTARERQRASRRLHVHVGGNGAGFLIALVAIATIPSFITMAVGRSIHPFTHWQRFKSNKKSMTTDFASATTIVHT